LRIVGTSFAFARRCVRYTPTRDRDDDALRARGVARRGVVVDVDDADGARCGRDGARAATRGRDASVDVDVGAADSQDGRRRRRARR
jgi:hypothetical protein